MALGLLTVALWYVVSSVGLLNLWAALFAWYPFLFAWQVVTYQLERRGILKQPPPKTLVGQGRRTPHHHGPPRQGPNMTVQKYDWERIHIEYISGRENGDGMVERPTLEALAQSYNIPPGTLRNRAHREGWAEERNVFVTSLLQKTREKTLEQLAEKASQLDLQAFSVARAMLILAARELREGMEGKPPHHGRPGAPAQDVRHSAPNGPPGFGDR